MVRKHTGERPFQCHCSRRFSRLDNLRQHAQTVHVNEDIPIDSLAASGSRFQRQIRTDRVRQAGNRARASTGGSAGGPMRGHSKSLSTSSINSVSSVGSAYGYPADDRRRPPPLVMAADGRSRLSTESYPSNADSNYSYRPHSPGGFSTPTSATFSTAQSSPRWPSSMGSPTSSHSRSHSMYSAGGPLSARRLSVPSGHFGPGQPSQGRMSFGPPLVNSSNAAVFSPTNSHMTSPSSSTSGWHERRDSSSSQGPEDWRRRTWHPETQPYGHHHQHQPQQQQPQQHVAPNPAPPMLNPASAGSAQSGFRLPGIESFDPIGRRPESPTRRQPSPMAMDEAPPRPSMEEQRRNLNMYDASLQRGIGRLDIGAKVSPPRDSASSWASEVNRAVQAHADRPTVRFEEPAHPPRDYAAAPPPAHAMHQHTMSAPAFDTSRASKRHGWYRGPPPATQAPAADPRAARVERMVHPNISSFSGFPAAEAKPTSPQEAAPNQDSLRRLEALVAVATSEGSSATATAY